MLHRPTGRHPRRQQRIHQPIRLNTRPQFPIHKRRPHIASNRGRKWIMMTGMLLGILFYRPIFSEFLQESRISESQIASIGIIENNNEISRTGILLNNNDSVINYAQKILLNDGWQFTKSYSDTISLNHTITTSQVKYSSIKVSNAVYYKFIMLVFFMILFVTMVYGPIAAFLVELFPTKIRYTSMSLPYHIGNGVFGGLVPFIGLLLTTTYPLDPLVGLWYPIGVAALCLIIGTIYLTNKIDKDVTD
jgi:hypothetical protein